MVGQKIIKNPKIQLMTDDIDDICSAPKNYHDIPRYTYVGTKAADEALIYLQEGSFPRGSWGMVFNTDPSDRPGQHWIALFAKNKNKIEIMDSYGAEHLKNSYQEDGIVPEILEHVYVSPDLPRLQGSNTYVCGHYCISYLYVRTRGDSLKGFVKPFDSVNTSSNDVRVYEFARNTLMKNASPQSGGGSSSSGVCQGCCTECESCRCC